MIYVFIGSDFSILNSSVEKLISDLNLTNIIKYDFNDITIRDLLEEVNYVDLYNEKKLIVVSDFSFKKVKDDDEKLLMRYIENMNDNVIILKCSDEALDERRSLTKLLKSKCDVRVIEKLDYKNLHQYVSNMLKDNNIEANFNQIKKILDLCDYNPDYTINEVNKLLIYKIGENVLYDKDITDVIIKNNDKEMFKFLDYVIKKDIAKSIDSYKILISSGTDVTVIIENLSRHFRFLMQLKELMKEKTEVELMRIFGVQQFVLKKMYPFVNEYTIEDIANILYKLSNVDIDIKVNGLDRNELMERFIIEL